MAFLTANIIDEGAANATQHNTIFSGDHEKSTGAGYRFPIWSYGDHYYVGMNKLGSGGFFASIIAKVRKSDHVTVQQVSLPETHPDGLSGHSSVQVAVAPDGTVWARPQGHTDHEGLRVYRTTTPENLSTFVQTPEPTPMPNQAWRMNYRSFWFAPDGTVYLWVRAYWDRNSANNVRNPGQNSYPTGVGYLWRWDGAKWVNVRGANTAPIQHEGPTPGTWSGTESHQTRPYQFHIAFSPDGQTMYGVSSLQSSASYQGAAMVTHARAGKSPDGGATWQTLDGTPFPNGEPFTLDNGTDLGRGHHRARVEVDETGAPVFIYGWVGPDYAGNWSEQGNTSSVRNNMQLWVVRWNGTELDYVRLTNNDSASDIRPEQHSMVDKYGRIIVTARDTTSPFRVKVFIHNPGEPFEQWHRYDLADPIWHWAYPDIEGVNDENVLRTLVLSEDDRDDSAAQVYEFTLAEIDTTPASNWSDWVQSSDPGGITWGDWSTSELSEWGPTGGESAEASVDFSSTASIDVAYTASESISASIEVTSTSEITLDTQAVEQVGSTVTFDHQSSMATSQSKHVVHESTLDTSHTILINYETSLSVFYSFVLNNSHTIELASSANEYVDADLALDHTASLDATGAKGVGVTLDTAGTADVTLAYTATEGVGFAVQFDGTSGMGVEATKAVSSALTISSTAAVDFTADLSEEATTSVAFDGLSDLVLASTRQVHTTLALDHSADVLVNYGTSAGVYYSLVLDTVSTTELSASKDVATTTSVDGAASVTVDYSVLLEEPQHVEVSVSFDHTAQFSVFILSMTPSLFIDALSVAMRADAVFSTANRASITYAQAARVALAALPAARETVAVSTAHQAQVDFG